MEEENHSTKKIIYGNNNKPCESGFPVTKGLFGFKQ